MALAQHEKAGISRRWNFQRNESQREAIRDTVRSGAAMTAPYLAMNAAATLLAGFGLLENSPAVIIGAMLVAMLFGPIVGIAMGLAEANLGLLRRSIVSEIAGAILVLTIGFAIGLASRNVAIGSEILSRASPSILDLLIGLVGGLAGGFTLVSTDLAGVMVGVAISTALVPPLTACGILLGRHLHGLAIGAFLLFLANFSAISFGAMTIFWVSGHRPPATDGAYKALFPRLVCFLLFVVLGIHLTATFHHAVTQALLETDIRKTLSAELRKIPGASLASVTVVAQQNKSVVWAVVRAPQPVSPEQVQRLTESLNHVAGSAVSLRVRSVITAETTAEGYIYEPELEP